MLVFLRSPTLVPCDEELKTTVKMEKEASLTSDNGGWRGQFDQRGVKKEEKKREEVERSHIAYRRMSKLGIYMTTAMSGKTASATE